MAEVVVSVHRRYPFPPSVMWRDFTDPAVSSALDDRITLVASDGTPGTVGSPYDLTVKMGPLSLPQKVTFREGLGVSLVDDLLSARSHGPGRFMALAVSPRSI